MKRREIPKASLSASSIFLPLPYAWVWAQQSDGAQIPWESTSLEEDFWFIPPRQLKKLSEDELEKQSAA